MAILYSCVASGSVLLAEHLAASSSNASSVVKMILEKVEWADGLRKSYSMDNFVFHFVCGGAGLTFLCMADESFERRRAHAFLDDIKGRFVSTYGRVSPNVRPMAMQSDFSRVLQKQADFFSFDPSSDKITQVREEVNKTKQVMVDSIDKVLQRGEKIELLVQQTDQLQEGAVRFNTGAKKLKFVLWRKNMFLIIGIVVVSIVALWLILSLACGFDFHKCGAGGGGGGTTQAPTTTGTTTTASTTSPTTVPATTTSAATGAPQ